MAAYLVSVINGLRDYWAFFMWTFYTGIFFFFLLQTTGKQNTYTRDERKKKKIHKN